VAVVGTLTACVAFLVDVAVATVSDWKSGFCATNPLLDREACCKDRSPVFTTSDEHPGSDICQGWTAWSDDYAASFAIYVGFALLFGLVSGSVTMLTRRSLPAVSSIAAGKHQDDDSSTQPASTAGKSMYMAAGSGIPEIKTILSGFVIPNFLDLRVLVVKAVGAVFAVSTGMCLGKEGPFVHISTCVGYLVVRRLPKYRDNGRKMRGNQEPHVCLFALDG